MVNKKEPAGVAAPTGRKELAQSPSCNDYITYTGKLTRERIHELTELVFDFMKKCRPYYEATIWLSCYRMSITIYAEYGRGGYGHCETYNSEDDDGMNEAEARLKKIMEGYNGQNT